MSSAVPVSGTTRYLCPLECGWHHDVPPPSVERVVQLGSTADLVGLPPGEAVSTMATQAYLAEAGQTETALREHLDTHTTVEFVQTIQRLRACPAATQRGEHPMKARDRLLAYLRQTGLSTARAEANLDAFAHELAEQIRAERGSGTYEPGVYFRSGMDYAADIIDPQASVGPARPNEEPAT